MAAKSRIVKWQKVREVEGKPFTGERSAYWDWASTHSRTDENGFVQESREANPDTIEEGEPTTAGTINREAMKEAIKTAKLSVKQRAVIELLGIRGHSEEKAAKLLGVNRSTVRVLMRRAQKKCFDRYVTILANHVDIGEDSQENL